MPAALPMQPVDVAPCDVLVMFDESALEKVLQHGLIASMTTVMSTCLPAAWFRCPCTLSTGRGSIVCFPRVEMASTNPLKSFKNVCDAKHVYQHYEKLKVENSLSLKESIEFFEVLYKKGPGYKDSVPVG